MANLESMTCRGCGDIVEYRKGQGLFKCDSCGSVYESEPGEEGKARAIRITPGGSFAAVAPPPAGSPHPVGNGGGSGMADFLAFRSFIAPMVIQVAFWISVFLCLMSGIYIMAADFVGRGDGGSAAWQIIAGLIMIVLGPIMARVCCELLLLAFRIHDELKQVNHSVRCINHGILRLIKQGETGERASFAQPPE